MDNEQLQDWLCKLHEHFCPDRAQRQQQQDELETNGCDGASTSMDSSAGPTAKKGEEKADEMEQQQPSLQKWRHQLQQLAPQTNMLLNYFVCNFNDPRLSEPLVAQLLALYYRLGIARCFVLQLVPTFIHSYLKALTKRWSASAKMLEMFFLAIYNEEILAAGPCTPSMAKRADEVRLPSLRRGRPPSASKLGADQLFGSTSNPPIMGLNSSGPHKTQKSQAETIGINITRPAATAALVTATAGGGSLPRMFGSAASGVVTVTSTGTTAVGVGGGSSSGLGSQKAPRNSVRIGPFPAIEKIIAENRFLILTRLLRTVNQMLPKMAPEVVCRAMCLSLLYICRSGFSFQESDFRQRVLREWASNEVFADFSRKSRIRSIPSHFLVESINGLTYALLNGHEDAALRALDAIHQRAQYELMADVLLETNALRHALSDPKTVQTILSDGDSTTMNGNGTKVEEEATKTPPAATAVGNDEELRKWQPNSTNSQKINSLAPTS